MAARFSLPEDDLCCPVCCDVFRDPVVLKCSHSFCAACLQQYWSGKGSGRDCPLCRREFVDEPVASLTLKNLCDSYIQGSGALRPTGELCEPGELCSLHGERLKLFCLQDKEPICVVCHTSRKHKNHECCPVEEAIGDIKEEMKSVFICLQEKREAFDKMKQNYENTVIHIQVQARFAAKRIHEEFEKLHHFLQAEEAARLAALKEEEESKSEMLRQSMREMDRTLASLSDTIRAMEEEMALEDIALLHKCKQTMRSAQCITLQDPVMVSGALIDVAKYLGSLQYKVWEKMQGIVKYTPVTLDPNTAAPWLLLSEDLTSVRDSDDKLKLPDNPERFDPDTGVLGSEGFSSGKHVWDVEVGENSAWVLGVAKESIKRKEKVSSVLKNGYLSVYFYHKMYFAGTSPLTRLNLKKSPQRIRVQLDWEKGRVCFSDPTDNTQIYTFKHTFSERVFPYFWVGCKQCPLRIEPLEVSVKSVDHT
ncbi:E3 ubiquitin-protein ligase TRIM35-like [Coregonus clupeaformis]|uniref:E3 ubiquitin-protein ligase TRIM35-like n=1 Tax=Coregonus clupeaformis TaxID=59861 RepID=UPI001BE07814|nr:E3 ubiquitin-protein ligase TRIM35-like [Coregonus clupeaformis]